MVTPVLVSSRQKYVNSDGTPTREFYIFLTNLLAEVQGGALTFGTAAFENIGTAGGNVPLLNAANIWSALQTFDNGDLALAGATSGHTVLEATGIAGGVITFPNATDTVVLLAATQTITNKTIQSTANTMDVAQIAGTVTNDAASAGNLGEILSSNIAVGAAVTATSATPVDITSIHLTPGDWDVYGNVALASSGSPPISNWRGWINNLSASVPTAPGSGAMFGLNTATTVFTPNVLQVLPCGMRRLSSDGTVTAYLSVEVTYASGSVTAYGFLGARRRR